MFRFDIDMASMHNEFHGGYIWTQPVARNTNANNMFGDPTTDANTEVVGEFVDSNSELIETRQDVIILINLSFARSTHGKIKWRTIGTTDGKGKWENLVATTTTPESQQQKQLATYGRCKRAPRHRGR